MCLVSLHFGFRKVCVWFFFLLSYFKRSLFSLVWTAGAVRDGLLAAAFAVCC